ncbi:MAG: carbamoyltransferase HypF [Desulfuromonadales bacterium]|nr:carbamoyltransferase HypF [Desulfuromonadales bacterium]
MIIDGIVQGVGFRPFVYQLATRLGVVGWVRNDARGVTIEAQAAPAILEQFCLALQQDKPPLSVINNFSSANLPPVSEAGFTIQASQNETGSLAGVPPDTFVCDDCLAELFDPTDRRYRYPFINCTNCGPRYSIITGIPYDRPLTTMADFSMCSACRLEYESPDDRRFHAQPNACPDCGPQLSLVDSHGSCLDGCDPLAETVQALLEGRIVAIKGLGGYHLAVDASNAAAIRELRRRKLRDEKPFAIMSRDLDQVSRYAYFSPAEAKLLSGVERPIVLLQKKATTLLADEVAPGNRFVGAMLPYTPLHHLLFEKHFLALVMTSANLSDEPIAYEDEEACSRLAGIADLFLQHDRRIHTRTDDSIMRVMADRATMIRRSRGFVPRGIALPAEQASVLGVGAELKNCLCLTRADRAFLSQHIGDLKNLEVYEAFKRTADHLQSILEVRPEIVAHDLHPDYYSTCFAEEECGLPTVAVQHHHAHLASCLAEHGRTGPAIGVIFDGLGYGPDGTLWGGEFLVGDLCDFERFGHFRYVAMPGGDLATREPWRMALACLQAAFGEIPDTDTALYGIDTTEWQLAGEAARLGVNSPLTSSCGRLFDAVAALLGIRRKVSYEGQAALELEMLADPKAEDLLSYDLIKDGETMVFDFLPLIRDIVKLRDQGVPAAVIAGQFHVTLADMIVRQCRDIQSRTGLSLVALSGGVFQNRLLTEQVLPRLEAESLEVLTHSLVPPNDGGLALGQVAVAGFISR